MKNHIGEIRYKQGISLSKLSVYTGISKSQLGRIERGESDPTLPTAYKLEKALKTEIHTLFPGE